MTEHWNIKSRSTFCAESGRQFAEGEPFYTALFADEETESFERRDFSEDAWNKVGESLKPYSFWRTKFEAPPPAEDKDVVKKETAESLLRRLIEEDLPTTENARYILAVMLERKKILIQIETKPIKRGGRLLVYERHKTGEAFIVKDPQLRLEEVEALQEEVSSLLGGGKREREGEVKEEAGKEQAQDTAESGESGADLQPARSAD